MPAMSENEQRRAARKRLQAQYRALYDEVVDVLFEADPIGVHVHHNVEKFVPKRPVSRRDSATLALNVPTRKKTWPVCDSAHRAPVSSLSGFLSGGIASTYFHQSADHWP